MTMIDMSKLPTSIFPIKVSNDYIQYVTYYFFLSIIFSAIFQYPFDNKLMSNSIREIYMMVNHLDGPGVEGYHVDNKYVDHLKIKEQRILETSKDRIQSKKLASELKKTTFIDEVQKK